MGELSCAAADSVFSSIPSHKVFHPTISDSTDVRHWVTIVDTLANKLLSSTPTTHNSVYSAWSVATISALLRLATSGQSAKEVDEALGLTSFTGWKSGITTVISRLASWEAIPPATDPDHPPQHAIFHQAIGSFIAKDIRVKNTFVDDICMALNATSYRVNFHDPAANSAMHNWIGQQTGNLITSVGDYPPDIQAVLITTAYLGARWDVPFTYLGEVPFMRENGSKINTDFMQKEAKIRVANTREYQAIRLYYADAGLAMDILLPAPKVRVKTLITPHIRSQAAEALSRTSGREVRLLMPKWKINTHVDLRSWYQTLGIHTVFTRHADFSPLTTAPLYANQATHDAVIHIGEEGTVAAAVSQIGIFKAAMPRPMEEIHVNRPFVYHIVDTKLSLPLFSGIVADPSR